MTHVQILTGSPNVAYTADGTNAYVESGALLTRENIRTYNFGYILSTAGSLLFGSTAYPINGQVLKVVYTAANFTTGGSLYFQSNENNVVETFGSITGALNTSTVIYPVVPGQRGGTVSPSLNGYFYYSGIGNGGPLSGQLLFHYR